MIRSGRKVPTPAIPMPDLAVPYAAPIPIYIHQLCLAYPARRCSHPKLIAKNMPAWKSYQYAVLSNEGLASLTIPKNGANLGARSESAMMNSARSMRSEMSGDGGRWWLAFE